MKRWGLGILTWAAFASGLWMQPAAAQERTVRIGQAVPAMSFLPVLAARALGSFEGRHLKLKFTLIRGGDPAALAALDAGNIDFAAVGSDTALAAIAKGQPFEMIYSLMSQVTLQLVASDGFLKRAGVAPGDPLQERIRALKDATIGVTAVGGAQDRSARWLIAQGGLNKQNDIKIALIGPPPAIHAALDHGQIDGFILSPPQGTVSEQAGTGKVFIRLGKEFPQLEHLPYLVLVAKAPMDHAKFELAVATARALQAASRAVLADPKHAADEIQSHFYSRLKPDVVLSAVEAMKPGVRNEGKMTPEGITHLLAFTTASGVALSRPLGAKSGAHAFWTNKIVNAALEMK